MHIERARNGKLDLHSAAINAYVGTLGSQFSFYSVASLTVLFALIQIAFINIRFYLNFERNLRSIAGVPKKLL